jgi:hypothetical protein
VQPGTDRYHLPEVKRRAVLYEPSVT